MNKRSRFKEIGEILLLLLIFGLGCVAIAYWVKSLPDSVSKHVLKYKIGDIVYLKPDSTKAVVENAFDDWYTVGYTTKLGKIEHIHCINESLVY